MTSRDGHVWVSVDSGIGRLTLNRPELLNAVSHEMVVTLRTWLDRWRTDDGVRVVVIDGAGERGLSAGEDICELYEDAGRGGRRTFGRWADEYRLAATIARYAKPVVALMDGVVMGSGVGISAHASHRVVEDDTVIAMPEVGIGLVPGGGATYLLARMPGLLGTHVALTADRLDAADAIRCGIADWWVPRAERSALLNALAENDVDDALNRLGIRPPHDSELLGQRPWIDDCYSADHVEGVLVRLRGSTVDEAVDAAGRIDAFSPTAVKVTLRALREARSDSAIESSLQREYRVRVRSLLGHDALEGMRAQIIDRDRLPIWEPTSLRAVSGADVDACFAPLGPTELDLVAGPRGS